MRLSGMIFMLFSWGFIIGLALLCFNRIFRSGLGGKDSEKATERLRK